MTFGDLNMKYEAVLALHKESNPNTGLTVIGEMETKNSLEGILSDGKVPTFTWDDVLAKEIKLQAEYDAQEYARNRKEEYDSLNQFELISDDAINGTTTHKDAIKAIKSKYPKPE
tara:strand:- start:242 stop:586 length:345 start_codon:yes stop_codon:yes gene_type:complete